MIDLNNPEFVCEWSPVAYWKHALIIRLAELFNLRTFVETGTCYGGTIIAVREYFDSVHSIELSGPCFVKASALLSGIPGVNLYFGSSGMLLKSVLEKATPGPILFWLDAHHSGGETAGADQEGYGPLPDELETIFAMRPDSLVLIDDVAPNYIDHPQFKILKDSDWQHQFLNGVAIAHRGGYKIPERF